MGWSSKYHASGQITTIPKSSSAEVAIFAQK